MLVIRRMRVEYHLRAPEGKRETAERVHGMHHEKCPVYRTVWGCIDIETALVFEGA